MSFHRNLVSDPIVIATLIVSDTYQNSLARPFKHLFIKKAATKVQQNPNTT